jgi:hypothetical protein
MSITHVQDAISGVPSAGVFTATLSSPSASNFFIGILAASISGAAVTSITQTNVTWTKVVSSAVKIDSEIWKGIPTGTPGTSVACNTSGSPPGGRFNVSEWSYSGGTLDTDPAGTSSGSNNGNSTVVTTASVTPTASANALLVAVTNHASGNIFSSGPSGSGSGATWTAFTNNFGNIHYDYAIVTSTSGAYSVADTYSAANNWEAEIATFIITAPPSGQLFRQPPMNGLGVGGPFFGNPLF